MGYFPLSAYSKDTFAYVSFSGTLTEKTVDGQFSDNLGNSGLLQIVFKNKNDLQLSWIDDVGPFAAGRIYTFHRSDLETDNIFHLRGHPMINPQYEMVAAVHLPDWGDVYVVTEEATTTRTIISNIYLIDTAGNLLYDMGHALSGFNVVDLYAEDLDEDGSDEIMVILGIWADHSAYVKYIYRWTGSGFARDVINLTL